MHQQLEVLLLEAAFGKKVLVLFKLQVTVAKVAELELRNFSELS